MIIAVVVSRANQSVEGGVEITTASNDVNLAVVDEEPQFFTLLPNATQEMIHREGTSQARAYEWMKNDSLLEDYSDARLIQRYVLAVFYYATNGENWENKGGGTSQIPFDGRPNGPPPGQSGPPSGQRPSPQDGVAAGGIQYANVTSEGWLSYNTHEC